MTLESSCPLLPREDTVRRRCEPGRGPSLLCLDLGLSPSRTMRDKCLLFIIHPGCGILLHNPNRLRHESESEVAQSCPTLCDPMDCSLPSSSVHGVFQAIVLEWIAISFSSGSSQPRDRTQVSHSVDRRFTVWATREVQWILREYPNPESVIRNGWQWTGCGTVTGLKRELMLTTPLAREKTPILRWSM